MREEKNALQDILEAAQVKRPAFLQRHRTTAIIMLICLLALVYVGVNIASAQQKWMESVAAVTAAIVFGTGYCNGGRHGMRCRSISTMTNWIW